jgi:hypothetical protein
MPHGHAQDDEGGKQYLGRVSVRPVRALYKPDVTHDYNLHQPADHVKVHGVAGEGGQERGGDEDVERRGPADERERAADASAGNAGEVPLRPPEPERDEQRRRDVEREERAGEDEACDLRGARVFWLGARRVLYYD